MTLSDVEKTTSPKVTDVDARLAALGYTSELPRRLSLFSVLGLSFAIMAVPYGLSTTMLYGLTNGGPVTIFWGWILLSLISTCIAASLAEICSAYPTSGGTYYWSAMVRPTSLTILTLACSKGVGAAD